MKLLLFFLLLGAGVFAFNYLMRTRKERRRRALANTPFPLGWDEILKNNLPPYKLLSGDLREQLQGYVQIFIAEKSFEGCGGLVIDDEIKVTIAAQACMLLLNRKCDCYPKLYSILVYPSTYVAGSQNNIALPPTDTSVRLGESWNHGAVVLAWDSVKNGALNFRDGHNVTMHEFAHQLDQEDGRGDGVPVLGKRSAYSAWSRVFSTEYHTLQHKTEKGQTDVMDSYGATNPAEFFAVATETFFEKPLQLKKKHFQLYEELREFYRVDPAKWL